MTTEKTNPLGRPRKTSLPYVPVDPHFETHRRTEALIDALAEHTMIPESLLWCIPMRLFMWAGQAAIDGTLGKLSPRAIARRCAPEFELPPDVLYLALTDPDDGFLEVDEEGALHLHDWADYGGRVAGQREQWRERKAKEAERRARNRERKRAQREAKRGTHQEAEQTPMSTFCPAPVRGTAWDKVGTPVAAGCPDADLSHAETADFVNDNNVVPLSSGIHAELTQNSSEEGKGKVKDKEPHPPIAPAPVDGSLAPNELGAWLRDSGVAGRGRGFSELASLRPTVPELEAALVDYRPGASPNYLVPIIVRARARTTAIDANKAMGGGLDIGTPQKRPLIRASARTRLRRQWEDAARQSGLPAPDHDRLARLVEFGPPDQDTIDLMQMADSWDAYDRAGEAARSEAFRAIEAGLGVAMA